MSPTQTEKDVEQAPGKVSSPGGLSRILGSGRRVEMPFAPTQPPGRKWLWVNLTIGAALLSSCADSAPPGRQQPEAPSILEPGGPAAAEIASLWWIMFGLALAVFVVVMLLLLYALFRRRPDQDASSPTRDRVLVIVGGIVVPAIILAVLFGFTLRSLGVLAAPDVSEDLVIEVVGHQWWWEIHYPDQNFTTANEIHIPAGLPVELRLTSADVIHSFWVPKLHGKIDLVPNRINTFWLQADEPGVYYGECAEFCGIQHAKMLMVVVAQPPEEYIDWLEQQSRPAAEATEVELVEGRQVFLTSGCAECHTVRGTNATGDLGPDLTHLASRLTLAAGVLDNNRGNLGGWISNPQNIKPGNKMPAVEMTGPELNVLLTYLESLQ